MRAFSSNFRRAGHRFTIWVGWAIGVIFPSNSSTPSKRLYDQLLGPLIFLLLCNSTVGFVDAITEAVQHKTEGHGSEPDYLKWLTVFNQLLPFTLLNTGYLAKNKTEMLKIRMKREAAAAMECSRNGGLTNLYRNIDEWNWKMSAAGFFTVDRSLVMGIASATTTYIILLFQIQGVLKVGSGDDDHLRKQLFRILTTLNITQFSVEREYFEA